MTWEEAIQWLEQIKKNYIHGGDEEFDTRRKEALDMAIQAIKLVKDRDSCKRMRAKVITRGNCMMCGKELTEGLFFCKECEEKERDRK